ncbi:hypothetical protein BN136_1718 [Cronobacter universalis NCTC 9529]|nr:hypothetical protein BN136_1718 [Cronobacter universalis NCTC 9529]
MPKATLLFLVAPGILLASKQYVWHEENGIAYKQKINLQIRY